VIDQVRSFNRFYTRHIGVLNQGLLDSPYSLTEARVLYELANRQGVSASDLTVDLGLDPGYLSRILARFQKAHLLRRKASPADRRRLLLELTPEGRKAFAPLNQRSHDQADTMLNQLSAPDQNRLLQAMRTIQDVLDPQPKALVLRDPRRGELGWIIHRQAVLYAEEYGWTSDYETLIAGIVSQGFERCWIAEFGGRIAGSVFLMVGEGTVAKLRLLYVEPFCRGKGVGRTLVRACIEFARESGYTVITLWTNSILTAARKIYETEGFQLLKEEKHRSFGHDLTGQTWELKL
jgi:DNA-binding MarR family transcriptional regulator/GNAT superfamily N-acetyltransferase